MPYKKFGARSAENSSPFKPLASKRRPRRKVTIETDGRRSGSLTKAERAIITTTIAQTPGDLSDSQVQGLAITLRRRPEALADAIAEARAKLVANAGRYVDLHLEAAESAMAQGDPDVARKAAEFAIEKLSARRSDGTKETIIERETTADTAPRISIGVMLGGMPRSHELSAASITPTIDVSSE